jgi:hypothetical protein
VALYKKNNNFFLKERERERSHGVAEAPLWATKVVRPLPWANPQILAHEDGSATPKGQNPFFFNLPWGG